MAPCLSTFSRVLTKGPTKVVRVRFPPTPPVFFAGVINLAKDRLKEPAVGACHGFTLNRHRFVKTTPFKASVHRIPLTRRLTNVGSAPVESTLHVAFARRKADVTPWPAPAFSGFPAFTAGPGRRSRAQWSRCINV